MKRLTIAQSVSISGIGLHTGEENTLTLFPNPKANGIVFKGADGVEKVASPALVESTNRSTNINVGGKVIHTIEHLLSALSFQGINNVVIDVDKNEVPILDGSALPFVELLEAAGVSELDGEVEVIELHKQFEFRDEETGAHYRYTPSDRTKISCKLDFSGNVVGQQYASITNFQNYKEQIAPARTFVFVHELEALLDAGLIKGGSFDNAIVFAKEKYSKDKIQVLASKFGISTDGLSEGYILNAANVKFSNEPARHKLLDLIGDLNLLGRPIRGRIESEKPGHSSNVKFAKELYRLYKEEQKTGVIPLYNPNNEPVHDLESIKGLLPHRFPFLLIDKVISLSDSQVVAVKNISGDQYFFPGHFPGNPIFPGVLQMEALAQTGGILALSTVPDPENYDTYFLKMDNVRFKQLVKPGDTLLLKMELLSPIRRGIVHMQGTAYVGNKVVSEGELTARIHKSEKK